MSMSLTLHGIKGINVGPIEHDDTGKQMYLKYTKQLLKIELKDGSEFQLQLFGVIGGEPHTQEIAEADAGYAYDMDGSAT